MGIEGVSSQLLQPLLADFDGMDIDSDLSSVEDILDGDRIGDLHERGEQLVGHAPLVGLAGHVEIGANPLERALDQWEATAPPGKNMPKQVTVTMPGSGHAVRLDGAMMEEEISALPEDQREEAVREAPKELQKRVTHGHELWQGVRSGDITGPASLADVRDLMTFLSAKGMEKSDGFSEGAFSVEDPGNRLRNFLDSCPEVYQRVSSHIEGFADQPGCGHRGIDMTGDVKLPFGKATVLFGAMRNGVEGMNGDRLFIKMESHGCRLASSFMTRGSRDAQGPANRPLRFFRDLGQTLGHALGFAKTLLRSISGGRWFANSPESRKERIPSDVKSDYKALIERFRTGDPPRGDMVDALNMSNPTSSGRGIRTMLDNINQILQAGDMAQGEDREALIAFRDKLMARYDHTDVRIGDEMILNVDELGGTDTSQAVQGQARAIINDLLSLENPEDLTGAKLEKLAQQLTRMGQAMGEDLELEFNGSSLEDVMQAATEKLSNAQKEHLLEILGSDQCKGLIEGMSRVGDEDYTGMDGLTDTAKEESSQVGRSVTEGYTALVESLGGEVDGLGDGTEEGTALARDTLSSVGRGTTITRGSLAGIRQDKIDALPNERAGEKTLSEVRDLLGRDTFTVGTHSDTVLGDGVPDKAAISEDIETELNVDLNKEVSTGYRGLARDFIVDFFRRPVNVNGEQFGDHRGFDEVPQDEREEQLDAFIEAMGGERKAQLVSKVAFQNVPPIVDTAMMGDDSTLGLIGDYHTFGTQPTRPNTSDFSITTRGDGSIGVRFDFAEHRVAQQDGDHELGRHVRLDYTITNTGQDQVPGLEVTNLDFLFSSNPPVED